MAPTPHVTTPQRGERGTMSEGAHTRPVNAQSYCCGTKSQHFLALSQMGPPVAPMWCDLPWHFVVSRQRIRAYSAWGHLDLEVFWVALSLMQIAKTAAPVLAHPLGGTGELGNLKLDTGQLEIESWAIVNWVPLRT